MPSKPHGRLIFGGQLKISALSTNRLKVQGVELEGLTKEFGSPVYVYDAEKISSQISKLKNAFSNVNLQLKYAAKALTNISVLKHVKNQGVGLDVVSKYELELGLLAGFKPEEIIFTPNGVSFDEIEFAVEKGVQINIDNISVLEHFGNAYHNTVRCCVRINPHIMAGGNHKISTGHVDSKFGVSILQVRHLMRVIEMYNINVNGLHMHTGSDILDADIFLKGAEVLFDVARDFKDLHFIDFGSGFKVAYREGDIMVDIDDLGAKLSDAFANFCKEYGRDLELWFEPGKYLVSESGYLLVTTNVIKTTPSSVFVGVDSGMNHLIRPMMYDAYHDIINITNPEGTKRLYTVVGYICETDTLGWDRKMSEVREGDVLAIKNAGAYAFSMASNYNSRLRPPEVLIIDGEAILIRKRESMDDLLRLQVDVDI